MANDSAKVTITKKHKFSMGTPDAAGNKMIFVTGAITMATETGTPSDKMELDLSGDIKNIEGVFIQGDGGYVCQYDYAGKTVEVYQVVATPSEGGAPLVSVTSTGLSGKVFYFQAYGF